jgi:hypothetical protein
LNLELGTNIKESMFCLMVSRQGGEQNWVESTER